MPYHTPLSLDDAFPILERPGCRVIAGCTDFFPSQRDGMTPDVILDVLGISECQGISRDAAGWRFGAAVTWADVVRADLPPVFDGLKQAALQVGSVQIQNRATMVGNICNASPAADGVPPLLTLDAKVEIASAASKRLVPLGDFITGVRQVDLKPGELVSAIRIPATPQMARSAFSKLGSRTHLVISIAMVAAAVGIVSNRIADIRLAVGSCSAVAQRLSTLENRLKGTSVADLAPAMAPHPGDYSALSPISDVRGSAEYRIEVVAELCRRTVEAAIHERTVA